MNDYENWLISRWDTGWEKNLLAWYDNRKGFQNWNVKRKKTWGEVGVGGTQNRTEHLRTVR